MKTEVVMPQMGESVAEGTLTQWFKQVGDRVERDEPLFEITTDKVDAEVESPADGTLVEIRVEPGTTVEINTVVAILETEATGDVAPSSEMEAPSSEPQSQPQQPAAAERPAAAASSAAAAAPVTNGVSNGAALAAAPATDASADELRRTRSTPLVRRIAEEHGIADLSPIPGSGLSGRVTKQDIMAWIDSGKHQQPAAARPAQPSAPQRGREVHRPTITPGQRDRVEMLSPQRQSIARHMLDSRAISAHAQTVHEVDFSRVWDARKQLKGDFAERGVHLTFTAFMVKAAAEALADFPMLNASLDGDQIVYRGDINVGVAVDMGGSLIVPVVRNVDELSLLGVARAVNDLGERARNKKLKPDEVKEGTFTLSNPGIFGSEFGIPIINQPQSAILATGAIKKRVVVDQKTDAIMVKPTAIWCLSFDHRLVDGATADRFMLRMREAIENWS